MRAYVMKHYGGPEAVWLTDLPEPAPGPSELLVKVRAAGLNPIDVKIRQGQIRVVRGYKFPIALGNELAGDVVAVGSQVRDFAVGDRVYGRVDQTILGTFAELARIDQSHAARIPDALDYVSAAAVPLAGLTALQALRDVLEIKPGQKLFISGGAGGVGLFAIQIAKWLGAEVATTASPRGEAFVRAAGADTVIDYTTENFETKLAGYDAGFDLIGGETLNAMFQVIKPGGKVVSVAGAPEPQTAMKDLGGRRFLAALFWLVSMKPRAKARRAGVAYRFLFMQPSRPGLELLSSLIDQGRLKITIDRAVPFDRIAEAMAYLESGRAKGKVVVQMV